PPTDGMQNTDTRVVGVPVVTGPVGEPTSLMKSGTTPVSPGQMALGEPSPLQPNAPPLVWPGQKRPAPGFGALGVELLAVPVVIGAKLTANEGSADAAGGTQS